MTTPILRLSLLGAMAICITGTVTDSTNAVVPHAGVTVKNEKTGQTRKVTANDEGVYKSRSWGRQRTRSPLK